MSIDSTWESLQQGSSWKLLFAIICNGEGEQVTEEYEVNNLALIHFKWKSVTHNNKIKIICSFSAKKHALATDSTVEMYIICSELHYTKQFFCNEYWSDWEIIGDLKPYNFNAANAYYDTLVVNFTAWRVERDRFSKLYHDTDFTDFHLSTPEGSIAVHKACLATHSDVFKTMLCGDWKETADGHINVGGVTLQTLKDLKEYMYLGTIPDDGLRPLLLIARCYLIQDLEEQCIRKLVQTVSAKNLFPLIEFACENNIPELAFAVTKLTKDVVISKAHEIRERKSNMETESVVCNDVPQEYYSRA